MEMKIELVPVPVSDTDVALDFYKKAGFVVDHDHAVQPGLRFVQLTPVGSACSIVIGEGTSDMAVGTQYIQMVVADAEAAYEYLTKAGIEASAPEQLPWGKFVNFEDPDGNRWALQQITNG